MIEVHKQLFRWGVVFVLLILDNFGDNHLWLDKNIGERKKKKENKNTCEYGREDGYFKNCQKVVVQISFHYLE